MVDYLVKVEMKVDSTFSMIRLIVCYIFIKNGYYRLSKVMFDVCFMYKLTLTSKFVCNNRY